MVRRVPVDRITAEARQANFGRAVLTVIAAVLFSVGWVAARAVGVVWVAAAWCAVAVRVGWNAARAPAPDDEGG